MRWRTLTSWSGRKTSDSIADLWSVSTTSQDPQIPNLPLETPSGGPPTYQGVLKWWNGSTWAKAKLMRWTGSSWAPAVLKRWTGSAWVEVDATGA